MGSQTAVQKFIASTRQLHAEEKDPAKRWQRMTPLLEELLADASVKEQSKNWPDCSQGGERAENLLFYEDPDYKFVINGLIKAPHSRTQIHDHAHNWTLYGVLDGARLFEEIDRLGISDEGVGCLLSAKADFDFYRALPSGGYAKGRRAEERTDIGDGDIPAEIRGKDFFPYRPGYLRKEPPMSGLARLTNVVQKALNSGKYLGAIWLEGSPFVEETTYWLNLLIDTTVPICGNSSQRPHGAIANDGDRNIVDSVDYITSRIWADENGRDSVGAVAILDEQIFTSRDVQKSDARPGGYVATGGHGGIIGRMGHPGAPQFSFKPVKRHTHTSAVNVSRLPREVQTLNLEQAIL